MVTDRFVTEDYILRSIDDIKPRRVFICHQSDKNTRVSFVDPWGSFMNYGFLRAGHVERTRGELSNLLDSDSIAYGRTKWSSLGLIQFYDVRAGTLAEQTFDSWSNAVHKLYRPPQISSYMRESHGIEVLHNEGSHMFAAFPLTSSVNFDRAQSLVKQVFNNPVAYKQMARGVDEFLAAVLR